MLVTKLRTVARGPLPAGLLVTTLFLPGLYGLRQPSLAQQPAGKQPPQGEPANKQPGKNAPDQGQDGVRAVKPGPAGAAADRKWIVGTWRSYKLDYGDFKTWKGTTHPPPPKRASTQAMMFARCGSVIP